MICNINRKRLIDFLWSSIYYFRYTIWVFFNIFYSLCLVCIRYQFLSIFFLFLIQRSIQGAFTCRDVTILPFHFPFCGKTPWSFLAISERVSAEIVIPEPVRIDLGSDRGEKIVTMGILRGPCLARDSRGCVRKSTTIISPVFEF